MRVFFDSNVAVYALAADDPLRSPAAQRLLAYPEPGCTLVLSTQVLMETYNVLTRKKRADPAAVLAGVRLLTRFEVLAPSAQAVLLALDLAARHGLNAWDALIVQAAIEGGCERLYSEDMQSGRRFGALEVVNPFLHLGPALSSPNPPPPPTQSAPSAGRSRKTKPSSPAR
jgi:predicted nucleic acid-binding protein